MKRQDEYIADRIDITNIAFRDEYLGYLNVSEQIVKPSRRERKTRVI